MKFEKSFIENALKENFIGKTFENDGKEITVHDIKLFGIDENIAVEVEASGSFNGTLILQGKPVYDKGKKEVYVDDLDISVNTNNILHKAGAWMFKSKIKNNLKDMMRISIKENIEMVQSKIDEYIKEINDQGDAELEIKLLDSDIKHLLIKTDTIYTGLQVDLRIDATVHDLVGIKNISTLPRLKGEEE